MIETIACFGLVIIWMIVLSNKVSKVQRENIKFSLEIGKALTFLMAEKDSGIEKMIARDKKDLKEVMKVLTAHLKIKLVEEDGKVVVKEDRGW